MARAARSRPAARKGQTKSGSGKASPLPRKGKGAGKAAANEKRKGKAKVEEDDDDDEEEGDGGLADDTAVRDNSDDSDYQEGSDNDGSSEAAENDDDTDDDDSDFETARKKTKRSSSTGGKPSAGKKPRATARSAPNGTPSGNHTRISANNGSKKGSKTGSTAASSVAKANEAAAAAAGASAGNYGGGSSTPGAGGTGAAVPVKAGKGPAMRYVCEIARSGRALCRRCDEKISKDALKVGVVTEGSWGPSTQWHHMQCTIFQVQTAEEVEGFADLDDAVQPLLEQQVLKSQGEVDDMYEPITPDDLVRKEWTEKATCPDEVMATLLPYQAEGLAWMLNQEKLPYKGGILADEMGMGKTLQAICTLVANLPNAKDKTMQKRWAQSEEEMGQGGASAGSRGGTLVVCPTIALKQWQSELARFVKPGTLKVVIHHGAKRAALAEDLVKADVVLTTYAIVENEHRKAYAGNKVACPDCGRTLYPDKMFTHRKYFCGESAQRTEAQAKTQRKGGASWRRKNQGKKGKKADLSDSDNGTTEINIKVKGKGKGGSRSAAKGTKRKGSGKKGSGGKNGDVESDQSSDDATTALRVRVKSSTRAPRASSTAKGKRKGKAPNRSDEEDSSEDAQTSGPSANKRGKSARGGKGRSSGQGKANRREESEKDEDEDGGTTDISKSTRGKGRGGGRAKGKGKGKRKRKRKRGEDSDSDFEGTTDISNRNKQKGKTKRAAKGKGPKTKRAADDSGSDWTSGSDGSGSSSSSGDESDGRSHKEAAFAKVLKEMMEKRDNAEPGVLQEISWQRIMLDEAHFIKDRSTSTAKAVFALTSLYKWCLTGTPLQNRVGELYSLVRFLRLDPHAFYQCRSKGCDCKSLNYRFGPEWRACEECGHTPIMHYANFNRHILNPISRTGYVGEGKKAFLKLKREVLDQILLRRTKSNRSNDICLPPRIVRVRQHRLDEREEDFYQALYTQSQAQFDTYVGSGTILNNYAHIFDILIRLRQAVDHPYLVIYSVTKREGMTPAMNSPAGQTPADSSSQPATTPLQGSPPARSPAPMPLTVAGGTNGKPSSRPTRASRADNSGSGGGGGGGGGDGDSPSKKEGGVEGALGDTSSDSESDEVEVATGKSGAAGNAVKPAAADEHDSDEEDMDACGICSEPAERPVSSSCGHSFCRTCVQELIDTAPGDVECPTCSEPLTVDLSGGSPGGNDQDEAESDEVGGGRRRKGAGGGGGGRSRSRGRSGAGRGRGCGGGGSSGNDGAKGRMANMVATLAASVKKTMKNKKHASRTGFKTSVTKHSVINRIDLSKFQSSTKMEALMEEIHLMQERDPAAKALVFSQFVNMLDLIEYRMHKGQVGCRKLSGHLSVDKREEVLQAFQNDAGVKVLLISLKAGGVALNLTVANHIFLMDPWWNPAAEMQAIDRTHRLGQFKPIYATRFIIEDTVEERIIKLQEKKQLVFDSTVGGDAVSTGKLTVDDLRFLFAH